MPRLIDDIRAAGKLQMPRFVASAKVGRWTAYAGQLWPILSGQMPVFLIDNVSEYYYTSDQEYWDLTEDFPNLAPPFELAWFEHKMPKLIRSREKGNSDMAAFAPHGRVGVLMFGTDRENLKGIDLPENCRWGLTCELFIDYGRDGGGIHGPHGTTHMVIDPEGRLVGTPWMQSFAEESMNDMMQAYMGWHYPTLLAVSFLHCRNVRVLDEAVPKPLAKKYHARTGVWPAKYKTLEIRPLQEILRHEGKSEATGLQRALHICRGHFRDYRQGKGLFGKYHQLVWTPSMVRGTKAGTKDREYEIKLP